MMFGKTNAIAKGSEALKLEIFNPSISWTKSSSYECTRMQIKTQVDSLFYPVSASFAQGKSAVPIVYENIGYKTMSYGSTPFYEITDRTTATEILTGLGLNRLPDGTYAVCLSLVNLTGANSTIAYVCFTPTTTSFEVANGAVTFAKTGFSSLGLCGYRTTNILGIMVVTLIAIS